MIDAMRDAVERVRAAVAALDPALLSGTDSARLCSELAAAEKLCAAARARLAARAAEAGAHRRAGFTDAADWLARQTGRSVGEARAALDTVAVLDDLPSTAAALDAGELSLAQAAEIAKAAGPVGDPAERHRAEGELLDVARHHSLRALKDTARKRRLERFDPEELHRRQRRARYVRHWRDELGMIRIDAALPPEDGIPLVSRLEAETGRVRRRAKRQARADGDDVERWEQHAADALIAISSGTAKRGGPAAEVVIVCDVNARRRGHAHPGEACHIIGGGPIPVSLVKELEADAFLKAVLHDGVAIHTVKHFGRYRKAELRTALELGTPPEFEGVTCGQLGCDRRYGLQWDHLRPVAANGETSFENLGPKCWPHHREKSDQERRAGVYSGGDVTNIGGGRSP